ncbi:pyridoxal-phosphate dependent enzyme [Sneathiella aquimaris]|uniref:pyridoxal-phosphate dependent enzyme n=1 Tax=Sneathiella aquimaris TaxID=2599305 RepID=UPI00146DDBCC|nr:pyridoxal-phosphate dependent enzyme [Sneathiella aquimaris]
MRINTNPYRQKGLPDQPNFEPGDIVVNPEAAVSLMSLCPAAHTTPTVSSLKIAEQIGIAGLYVKDERGRMGLGSFKALGAAFAIAKQAAPYLESNPGSAPENALRDKTFVCASAGNHGLSMAAGARIFGATAVVYLSQTVPESFAEKLRGKGATVVREGPDYEASMVAARRAADLEGWQLLSDSSWPGYSEPARDVMEGYLIIGSEMERQIPAPPTHVFLQAGVGGLAAGVTAMCRHLWQEGPKIIIVEPEDAPCLIDSIEAGKPIRAQGAVSNMGRLDCKEPSHLALRYLAREADYFMTISDKEAKATCRWLAEQDLASTPSGVAGIAGLKTLCESSHTIDGLDQTAIALAILSEEATPDAT